MEGSGAESRGVSPIGPSLGGRHITYSNIQRSGSEVMATPSLTIPV
jgi:hypothetical protein